MVITISLEMLGYRRWDFGCGRGGGCEWGRKRRGKRIDYLS